MTLGQEREKNFRLSFSLTPINKTAGTTHRRREITTAHKKYLAKATKPAQSKQARVRRKLTSQKRARLEPPIKKPHCATSEWRQTLCGRVRYSMHFHDDAAAATRKRRGQRRGRDLSRRGVYTYTQTSHIHTCSILGGLPGER